MEGADRIIVALDYSSLDEALGVVKELSPYGVLFKVGLELLTSEGSPKVVYAVKELGGKVFYDGKFKDIPNTVAGASKAVSRLGVDMFNVHASGGTEMMEAAVANKGDSLVLAVTVLTSMSDEVATRSYGAAPKIKVVQYAAWAKAAKVDGLICSPQDILSLSGLELSRLIYVTPGVRPDWAATGDQRRVMTPGEAIIVGADYLVIGRPITRPPDKVKSPARAVELISEEIAAALRGRGRR